MRRDPKTPTKSDVQIVLLDHGLYVTISPKDRAALCQLWKAIILKDEVKMKEYASALGVQGKYIVLSCTNTSRDRYIVLKENDDIFLNLAKDYLTFATVLSMRPIHRPIHDLAILPEVWDRMSPDEQVAARAQGKIRLPVSKPEKKCFILSYLSS